MFDSALIAAAERSDWVRYLVASNSVAATETRAFLKIAFSNVRAEKQGRVAARIREGDTSQIEATIHELVAHELLRRLQLRPEFEPQLQEKNPDLLFETAGVRFISDVVVLHSPSKTVNKTDWGYEAWDTAEPSQSHADKAKKRIEEKADRYAELNFPIVPIVFLGDHRAFDFGDIEKACLGITLEEVALEAAFPQSLPKFRVPVGGLLLPREGLPVPYEHISAVIACDWFDASNRHSPGKRLSCLVLHYWAARQPLPVEAFSLLPQVCWDPMTSGGWKHRFTTERNRVLKFLGTEQIDTELDSPATS